MSNHRHRTIADVRRPSALDGPDARRHHDAGGNTVFGFWIYLMTDCILFATLFAVFAVLSGNIAGGPSGKDLFELPYVLVETCLPAVQLASPTASPCWRCTRATANGVLSWLAVTFLLGLGFIGMEINEFHHLIAEGNGPDRSALPVGVLHAGRHPRSARDLRPGLDGGADVPGQEARA